MKLSNKGYTMIELFAVIFIASAIIFPMVSTLAGNMEINTRVHNRRSATSIAQGTLDGFNRFVYVDIEGLVQTANTANEFYVEFDLNTCSQLPDSADQALCTQLFSSTWANFSLDTPQFKVFVYNYNLTSTMQTILVNNGDIPIAVRDNIALLTPTLDPNPELYYIVVWIEYDIDTSSTIILEGLISNE